ncbi:MAG: tyrosine-type recombinase/integrase [Bacteroidetes bacterium]|nr:tyrosine-type recombinase/integrase [Bacteroidota bacterium]
MVKARFVEYLQYEKRFSPHTVTAYSNDLTQFYNFLKAEYDLTDIKEVNHTFIRTWLVKMMEQEISPRSINRKITTLKTYYKFLLREGEVSLNPMLKIVAPKNSKRLPEYVEQEKMDRLLDFTEFKEGYEGMRDKMIIELFYATGIRLSELISLNHYSFDFYNNAIKVLGKRNKERIIPISFFTKEQLQKYLMVLKKSFPNAAYFFVTNKGEKLYPKFVYDLVKRNLGNVTTAKKKSPHVLRHSFATNMLNNGAELNAIKELLGHASLSATQVYTHNTIKKLKNIHSQAHPKA